MLKTLIEKIRPKIFKTAPNNNNENNSNILNNELKKELIETVENLNKTVHLNAKKERRYKDLYAFQKASNQNRISNKPLTPIQSLESCLQQIYSDVLLKLKNEDVTPKEFQKQLHLEILRQMKLREQKTKIKQKPRCKIQMMFTNPQTRQLPKNIILPDNKMSIKTNRRRIKEVNEKINPSIFTAYYSCSSDLELDTKSQIRIKRKSNCNVPIKSIPTNKPKSDLGKRLFEAKRFRLRPKKQAKNVETVNKTVKFDNPEKLKPKIEMKEFNHSFKNVKPLLSSNLISEIFSDSYSNLQFNLEKKFENSNNEIQSKDLDIKEEKNVQSHLEKKLEISKNELQFKNLEINKVKKENENNMSVKENTQMKNIKLSEHKNVTDVGKTIKIVQCNNSDHYKNNAKIENKASEIKSKNDATKLDSKLKRLLLEKNINSRQNSNQESKITTNLLVQPVKNTVGNKNNENNENKLEKVADSNSKKLDDENYLINDKIKKQHQNFEQEKLTKTENDKINEYEKKFIKMSNIEKLSEEAEVVALMVLNILAKTMESVLSSSKSKNSVSISVQTSMTNVQSGEKLHKNTSSNNNNNNNDNRVEIQSNTNSEKNSAEKLMNNSQKSDIQKSIDAIKGDFPDKEILITIIPKDGKNIMISQISEVSAFNKVSKSKIGSFITSNTQLNNAMKENEIFLKYETHFIQSENEVKNILNQDSQLKAIMDKKIDSKIYNTMKTCLHFTNIDPISEIRRISEETICIKFRKSKANVNSMPEKNFPLKCKIPTKFVYKSSSFVSQSSISCLEIASQEELHKTDRDKIKRDCSETSLNLKFNKSLCINYKILKLINSIKGKVQDDEIILLITPRPGEIFTDANKYKINVVDQNRIKILGSFWIPANYLTVIENSKEFEKFSIVISKTSINDTEKEINSIINNFKKIEDFDEDVHHLRNKSFKNNDEAEQYFKNLLEKVNESDYSDRDISEIFSYVNCNELKIIARPDYDGIRNDMFILEFLDIKRFEVIGYIRLCYKKIVIQAKRHPNVVKNLCVCKV